MRPLIEYRRRQFSQSGEDGVIARIFEIVGSRSKFCCEFGAWDGIRLSNTRALILNGWSGLFIEADSQKFRELARNYADKPNVMLDCSLVDDNANCLAHVLKRKSIAQRLDLLSIDIDGLDFNIFKTLDQIPALPRLVVVEVQPEHGPNRSELLPDHFANENIGQPLAAFVACGVQLGYRLVCYEGGNAFFLAEDVGHHSEIPTLTTAEAWNLWWSLSPRSPDAADYLYCRNLGLAGSLYAFNNPQLSAECLGIPPHRVAWLNLVGRKRRLIQRVKNVVGHWR